MPAGLARFLHFVHALARFLLLTVVNTTTKVVLLLQYFNARVPHQPSRALSGTDTTATWIPSRIIGSPMSVKH